MFGLPQYATASINRLSYFLEDLDNSMQLPLFKGRCDDLRKILLKRITHRAQYSTTIIKSQCPLHEPLRFLLLLLAVSRKGESRQISHPSLRYRKGNAE